MNAAANKRLAKNANRRDADMFAVASRHSSRVKFLKLAIPAFALIVGCVFAAITVLVPEIPGFVSTSAVSLSDGRIVMANPKLEGTTKDKRPYQLQAERALQSTQKDGLIELVNLDATLPFGPQNTATLSASGAIFDNANRKLELNENIVLNTSDGVVVKLQSAQIDIAKNHLISMHPVDITTSVAKITAQSLEVFDGGKRLIFDKNVRMILDPSKMNENTPAK